METACSHDYRHNIEQVFSCLFFFSFSHALDIFWNFSVQW